MKTTCFHFYQMRKTNNDPVLKLEDSEIPVIEQNKFFGMIYHKKVSFIPY